MAFSAFEVRGVWARSVMGSDGIGFGVSFGVFCVFVFAFVFVFVFVLGLGLSATTRSLLLLLFKVYVLKSKQSLGECKAFFFMKLRGKSVPQSTHLRTSKYPAAVPQGTHFRTSKYPVSYLKVPTFVPQSTQQSVPQSTHLFFVFLTTYEEVFGGLFFEAVKRVVLGRLEGPEMKVETGCGGVAGVRDVMSIYSNE